MYQYIRKHVTLNTELLHIHTKETAAFDESCHSALHKKTKAGDMSPINPACVW